MNAIRKALTATALTGSLLVAGAAQASDAVLGAVIGGGAGALIGMNAVVMDGAVIGERAFVGAHSFVKAGFVVPPATLATGSPAAVRRELTADELAWKANGTRT